jgi:hypothetical protein
MLFCNNCFLVVMNIFVMTFVLVLHSSILIRSRRTSVLLPYGLITVNILLWLSIMVINNGAHNSRNRGLLSI